MSYNKFDADTIIEIDGADYLPGGYSLGRLILVHAVTGQPFVSPDADGVVGLVTDATFDQLLLEGRAKIKSMASRDPVRRLNDAAEWSLEQALNLDSKVEKMLVQCQMADDAGLSGGQKAGERFFAKQWTPEMIAKYGPHDPVRTIRHWRRTRGRPGHRHPGQMVRMNGRVDRAPESTDVNRQLQLKHALLGWAHKGLPRDIHAAYATELALINAGRHPTIAQPDTPYKLVGEKTIRRRYNLLESSDTVAAKKGKAAVEQDWSGGGKPLTADFAMHRVIVDHTKLDVFAVDEEFEMVLGRAWLTVAIDVKTRAIVAHLITFIDPCNWTVGEILRRMALPKRPPRQMAERYPILAKLRGKPTEIVVDNAIEFRSHTLEAAARAAGFGIRYCPIKQPRYRAACERVIGTITRQICETLPGRTLPPREARRFGHDPQDEACVLMSELEAITNQVVAEYNTTPHGGIGNRQPALLFELDLNRNGVNNFKDLDAFRRDTMAVQENAQLSPSGIRAFGLRYHDIRSVRQLLDDLVPLEGRRRRRDDATATVDFRYDPNDISIIHVWNRKLRTYVELQCADERYAGGMPLWFHEQIAKAAKAQGEAFNTEEERLLARSRRISAIRNISPADSAKARKAIAELLEIPRIRQVTGNIVHLVTQDPEPVSIAEFIPNDRAALTALDTEILAPRAAPVTPERARNLKARRQARNVPEAHTKAGLAPRPRRATASQSDDLRVSANSSSHSRGPLIKGGFK